MKNRNVEDKVLKQLPRNAHIVQVGNNPIELWKQRESLLHDHFDLRSKHVFRQSVHLPVIVTVPNVCAARQNNTPSFGDRSHVGLRRLKLVRVAVPRGNSQIVFIGVLKPVLVLHATSDRGGHVEDLFDCVDLVLSGRRREHVDELRRIDCGDVDRVES
uniref:(northern house mosquito) hypothetical protein n=1 Tax=Culex pipiens TaxID=7175 RepID=A0A8D8AG07_CULPI